MCTTVIVGKEASIDGSTIIARNCDAEVMIAPTRFISVPANDTPNRIYKSVATGFTAPLPQKAQKFMMAPFVQKETYGTFGECGINESNVAMSSTESIYGNSTVLALDPLVDNGIGEDSLLDLVLPYITSARQGVEYLGKLIEKYGSHEGNGIAFSDENEVWYMEIPCGHHWVAKRLADDEVAVMSNMVCLQDIDFSDNENFMWSTGIEEFVRHHHLNPDADKWSFRRIFGTSRALDRRYNTPRVWFAQNYLGLPSDNPSSNDLPFSFKADRKISLDDVDYVLSSHYNETEYDPLNLLNPEDLRKKYRPISMERCAESHMLQIRGYMKDDLKGIIWYNNAPTAFNPYIPFYASAKDTAPTYATTDMKFKISQAYWMHRLVAVLAERDYNALYSIVDEYLADCKTITYRHITQFDAGCTENCDCADYLTTANHTIAENIATRTMQVIQDLLEEGMQLSALRYNVNTDVM